MTLSRFFLLHSAPDYSPSHVPEGRLTTTKVLALSSVFLASTFPYVSSDVDDNDDDSDDNNDDDNDDDDDDNKCKKPTQPSPSSASNVGSNSSSTEIFISLVPVTISMSVQASVSPKSSLVSEVTVSSVLASQTVTLPASASSFSAFNDDLTSSSTENWTSLLLVTKSTSAQESTATKVLLVSEVICSSAFTSEITTFRASRVFAFYVGLTSSSLFMLA